MPFYRPNHYQSDWAPLREVADGSLRGVVVEVVEAFHLMAGPTAFSWVALGRLVRLMWRQEAVDRGRRPRDPVYCRGM